ncbi:lipopolysaccharide kinase InaA family protein [Cycloclasticus sp.]|uniref:lipopolysaccharide kinase InaA family protein n=1 Tax=Cycloclasticus sp. TaxID=2024830 RepID=UPI000C0E0F70|nr:lipopolysaccharide kinase InaA family protein [Cycloclasticus sp.]PHR51019.1 MAG: lipopolysaccharide kinase [Cycloclasticus sp.]
MKHYIAEKWRDILVFNDLDSYEKVWALKADWFEEPNYRRGGWSGVSRVELKLPLGGSVGVFLKRQEDHVTRTLGHPIKGFSTFAREFNVIRAFQQHNIPSLEVVFFEQWKQDGHQRAFIMTEELSGYAPLSSEDYRMGSALLANEQQKTALFEKLAELLHSMHKHKFQHNCLYPKHVFAKQLAAGGVDLRVIDLEKVKKVLTKKQAMYRDLDTLLRHAKTWSDEDKLAFYKTYQGESYLSSASKRLWNKLNKK